MAKTNVPADRAMLELLLCASATFHKMRALGRRLGAVNEEGAGSWGVMRSLVKEGAQTVPQLARSRPVARQHIQKVINGLLDLGYVQLDDNPAHRRSKLVNITPAGRAHYNGIEKAILKKLSPVSKAVDHGGVEKAEATLERVNRALDQLLESEG